MDDPRSRLQDALKEAMKSKANQRRDVVRMALNSIKQMEIDNQRELSGAEALDVLQKEAKKRRESVDEALKAGREALSVTEKEELAILEEFLPRQLSADEVAAVVREVIAEVGATSAKDTGKVMGPVMQRVKGLADGKLVNQVVREQLGS